VETKLLRIAEKARQDPSCKFTSLFHLMNTELLRGCFEGLRKDAASGIDRVTKEEYGRNLEANLTALVERLHRMSYIPQPVRRVYIPKPGSTKQRPLGIPALEDKLVQAGLVRILEAVYEADFIDDSYGFRPDRGCHDALRALSLEVEGGSIHYIVEADIKGFFDNVQHDGDVTISLTKSSVGQQFRKRPPMIRNVCCHSWGFGPKDPIFAAAECCMGSD
jgi:hypothetical protein